MESSGRRRRPGIYRILLPPDRPTHVQVDFCTPNSGRADGVCRFGLADLSVKSAGKLSVPLQFSLCSPRGSVGVPVAPRDGREYPKGREKARAWRTKWRKSMRRRLWFFVPFVLAITVVAASGAGQAQSATGLAASTESSGSMPEVASAGSASNPEMQRLDRAFGGTWTTSESFAHNEFYPSGAER